PRTTTRRSRAIRYSCCSTPRINRSLLPPWRTSPSSPIGARFPKCSSIGEEGDVRHGGSKLRLILGVEQHEYQPQFAAAVANVAFLANRGAIPEMLIVGIANGKDRTRDMTPAATGATAKTFPTA